MPAADGVPTAAERAHAHIRDAIVGGGLEPGTMLSENALAGELSMSRTPVRAALARLQEEGWSNKAIARRLGVHPSTVGRWFTAPPALTRPEEKETP